MIKRIFDKDFESAVCAVEVVDVFINKNSPFYGFVFVSIPRIVVGITIYKNCHELKIQFKTN